MSVTAHAPSLGSLHPWPLTCRWPFFVLPLVPVKQDIGVDFNFDRMEYTGFNVPCALGPDAIITEADYFAVTHMREPISRQNSEYWYQGPGKIHHKASEEMWFDWINASRPRADGTPPPGFHAVALNFNEGIYFSNYYTRILTTDCGPCKRSSSKKTDNKLGGCSAFGPKYPYRSITVRTHAYAMRTLHPH